MHGLPYQGQDSSGWQRPRLFQYASAWLVSLLGLGYKLAWQLIDVKRISRLQLLRAGGRGEFEVIRRHLGAGLPCSDIERVLGKTLNLFCCDDIAAGIRAVALRNPDLPIDLFGAEGKVITLSPSDHATAEILYFGDQRHEFVIHIRQQEI